MHRARPRVLLCLRGDGLVVGSVSGGCIEDELIERVRTGARVTRPSLITYGVTKVEAARLGLPCGCNLQPVQEPLLSADRIDDLLVRTARHELVARTLRLATGAVALEGATRGQKLVFDGTRLRALFGPRRRLLMVGSGQLPRVLAQMAPALDFEEICCDPREEHLLAWDVRSTTFIKQMPDDLVLQLALFDVSPAWIG